MTDRPPEDGVTSPGGSDSERPTGAGDGWTFSKNRDLGAGTELDAALQQKANDIVDEARLRRRFRVGSLTAAICVLAVFLCAISLIVLAFVGQIRAVPKLEIAKLAEVALEKPTAAPIVIYPQQAASAAAPASAVPAASSTTVPPVSPVKLSASVSIDVASISNSIVAIVSVLVIASTVLAIALVRATFTMDSSTDDRKSEDGKSTDKAKKDDGLVAFPGVEMLKSAGEALSTVIKAVSGGKDGK